MSLVHVVAVKSIKNAVVIKAFSSIDHWNFGVFYTALLSQALQPKCELSNDPKERQ